MTDIREQEMQGKINELTAQEKVCWKQRTNSCASRSNGCARPSSAAVRNQESRVPGRQMSLFNEAETEAKPSAPEPEISVKPHKAQEKKVGHQ